MNELAPTPSSPSAPPMADARQTALIVYVLMLVPVVVPVTHIVGLVMAYVARDTAPAWLRSHYAYQINTFWIGILYLAISGLLCLVLIGFLLLPCVVVWWIVRCAIGLSRLMRGEAVLRPSSWIL